MELGEPGVPAVTAGGVGGLLAEDGGDGARPGATGGCAGRLCAAATAAAKGLTDGAPGLTANGLGATVPGAEALCGGAAPCMNGFPPCAAAGPLASSNPAAICTAEKRLEGEGFKRMPERRATNARECAGISGRPMTAARSG